MSEQTYTLEFDGYWREPNISGLPRGSAVYGVYACTYYSKAETVTLNRLIYIGEARDVNARIEGHEKWSEWRRELLHGEQLCFNAALITPAGARKRAEAAMIFKHKPVCNTEYKHSFPFDTTTVFTSGRNALMYPNFTVYRTTEGALGFQSAFAARR